MKWQEETALLAPLETFDPAAFREGGDVSQGLCNFVLALAVVYNDLKDAVYAHIALGQAQPDGPFQRTPAWGATLGARFHLVRVIFGMVHELLALLGKSASETNSPSFAAVIRHLDPRARAAWQALVAASEDRSGDALSRRLLRFRNSLAFHYEPNAFASGYAFHFLSPQPVDERAFISRGRSMRECRLYFADAAATGYLQHAIGKDQVDGMMRDVADTAALINLALFAIVETFIQLRGYGYRSYSEDDHGQAR